MGKQRQKKKTNRRRINPLQRKGIEAGINEANSKIPVPTGEQVAPVVERVKYIKVYAKTFSNRFKSSFPLKILLNVHGQQLVSQTLF
jgi:hypothetical protein